MGGFVPIRKQGKRPFTTVEEIYERAYGSATVDLRTDTVKAGDRVLRIDDLIATGGTMMAGKKLLEKPGATVTEDAAIVDLPELGGSRRLREGGQALYTLVDFAGHREPRDAQQPRQANRPAGASASGSGRRPCFSSDRRTGYC